jgi:hypothetical protein
MKKIIVLGLISLSCMASCNKDKKYCWKCIFTAYENNTGLDTTVCNMTETESENFQQSTIKHMVTTYGEPDNVPVTSACYKQNNR